MWNILSQPQEMLCPIAKKNCRSKIPWLSVSELASSSVHHGFPLSSVPSLSLVWFSSPCCFCLLLESASFFPSVAN